MSEGNTLVAVYGSLRQGHGNNCLLVNCEFLNTELSIPEFTMHSLGGFPALVEGTDRVVIELYKVDDYTFSRLDMLEGYPHMYNRRQIQTSHGDAWVYFMETLNWGSNGVVEDGDWTKFKDREHKQQVNSALVDGWVRG